MKKACCADKAQKKQCNLIIELFKPIESYCPDLIVPENKTKS